MPHSSAGIAREASVLYHAAAGGVAEHPLNFREFGLSKRSFLFRREPSWFSAHRGVSVTVDPSVRSWLFEAGSLTARLRAACGPGFGVRVLRQCWDRPWADESRALGLALRRHALVREVVLHCDGRPLVLARSVIPPDALRGVQCRLAHLGERPLGELLFAYWKLRRESLELTRIGMADWRDAGDVGAEPADEVWGRRSLYTVARGHVLVCEFFLPAVLSLPENWNE